MTCTSLPRKFARYSVITSFKQIILFLLCLSSVWNFFHSLTIMMTSSYIFWRRQEMIYLPYRLYSSSLKEIKAGTQCRDRSIDHKGTLSIGLLSLTAHLAFLYSPGQGTLGSMVNIGMDLHTSTNNEENVPQTSMYSSMIKSNDSVEVTSSWVYQVENHNVHTTTMHTMGFGHINPHFPHIPLSPIETLLWIIAPPFYVEVLIDLVLCRPCEDSHSCSEFMKTMAVSNPKHFIFLHISKPSDSFIHFPPFIENSFFPSHSIS